MHNIMDEFDRLQKPWTLKSRASNISKRYNILQVKPELVEKFCVLILDLLTILHAFLWLISQNFLGEIYTTIGKLP